MDHGHGESQEVNEVRALQLHYALCQVRRREGVKMRIEARKLHACANCVAALNADVCRLRKRVATARHAKRFHAMNGSLLNLAKHPDVIVTASEEADKVSKAVKRMEGGIPCAERLKEAIDAANAIADDPESHTDDAEVREKGIDALRELSNAVVRVKDCEKQLATLHDGEEKRKEALETLLTKQAFLQAYSTFTKTQNG